jgi:hypothetical protein
MYISGERAWCLRRVILGRGVCSNECACSGSYIIESAQWSMTSPPALEVASKCGNCGTRATVTGAREWRILVSCSSLCMPSY